MILLNKYRHPISDATSIMRPGIFGNPYKIGKDGTRTEVIIRFANYFHKRMADSDLFYDEVKRLAQTRQEIYCCCVSKPYTYNPNLTLKDYVCHGQVMMEYMFCKGWL